MEKHPMFEDSLSLFLWLFYWIAFFIVTFYSWGSLYCMKAGKPMCCLGVHSKYKLSISEWQEIEERSYRDLLLRYEQRGVLQGVWACLKCSCYFHKTDSYS